MQRAWFFLLALVVLSDAATALEGALPRDWMDRINGEQWTLVMAGTTLGDVIKEINKFDTLKVGVDPALTGQKLVKFEMTAHSVVAGAEKLAKQIGAKVFVLRDFLYIAKSLPPGMVASGAAPPPPAAGAKPPAQPAPANFSALKIVFPGLKPGSSKKITWVRKTPDECKQDQKPVVMLITSGDPAKDNPTSAFFDTLILEDNALLAALAAFTFVKISSADVAGWPTAVVERGRKGAALLLLTCDGAVVSSWTDASPQLTPAVVLALAPKVVEANNKLKEKPKVAEAKPPDDKEKNGPLPGLKEPPKPDEKPPADENKKRTDEE